MNIADEILYISKKIAYSYIVETRLDVLFSYLAEDISLIGPSKSICLEGYSSVTQYLLAAENQLVPCVLSNEKYSIKPLGEDYWLCKIYADVKTYPSFNLYIHEYQCCTFIFRRDYCNSNRKWELCYIHHSFSYNNLKENELFPLSYALSNKEKIDTNLAQINKEDKKVLYNPVYRSYSSMDKYAQLIFVALSALDNFTRKQAEEIFPDASRILSVEFKQNAFLKIDYVNNNNYFHPALKKFLQKAFTKKPEDWQKEQYRSFALWFLENKYYKQAINFAFQAEDFSLILRAIEKEDIYNLLSEQHIIDFTLEKSPLAIKTQYTTSWCKLFVCSFINNSKDILLQEIGNISNEFLISPSCRRQRNVGICLSEILRYFHSFNDIHKMKEHIQNIRKLLPSANIIKPIFITHTISCPSILTLYHFRPGNLQQELHSMQDLLNISYDILQTPIPSIWNDVIYAEWYYMTGYPEKAQLELNKTPPHNEYSTLEEVQLCHSFLQARLDIFFNKKDAIRESVNKFHSHIARSKTPFASKQALLCKAFLLPCISFTEKELNKLHKLLLNTNFPAPCSHFINIVSCRFLLKKNDYAKLLNIASENIYKNNNYSFVIANIYNLIFMAIAYKNLNLSEKSTTSLENAIKTASSEYIVMPFVEYYPYIESELDKLYQKSLYTNFIINIKNLIRIDVPVLYSSMENTENKQLDCLTINEQQIVLLVSNGMSNKDIAKQLNLAEITIKKILSSIYSKLGVKNRTALSVYFTQNIKP